MALPFHCSRDAISTFVQRNSMKRVEIQTYGPAEQVARCVDVADVGPPGAGEAVLEVLAFPINPADIGFCRGTYVLRPPLPATPGAECVGRILAVGTAVSSLAPGDLVINLQRENWAQKRRVPVESLIRLPPGIDIRQAAMLRINPPTARLMLTDLAPLQPDDWVLQNAANSAVGRQLIVLARTRGLHTINVVRSPDLFEELAVLGADVCLLDGPELPAQVRSALSGAAVRLAIDAVGGTATTRLAASVADGGTVCHYGAMSGEYPVVANGDLIFRGITLMGFMLGRALAKRASEDVRGIYGELAEMIVRGRLFAPVERVYPIEEIGDALEHAQRTRPRRPRGKILVAPNGLV